MCSNFIFISQEALGILSMFSVQFYVHFLTVFYIFLHYQSLLQNRAHMCNILFIVLIFYFILSYYFWTLKSIINNNIVGNLLFECRKKSYFMKNNYFETNLFFYLKYNIIIRYMYKLASGSRNN